jgi:hypothetical protein
VTEHFNVNKMQHTKANAWAIPTYHIKYKAYEALPFLSFFNLLSN